MKDISMDIEKLGFDNYFQDKIDPAKLTDYQIASGDSGSVQRSYLLALWAKVPPLQFPV